jgi:hypothetical protein
LVLTLHLSGVSSAAHLGGRRDYPSLRGVIIVLTVTRATEEEGGSEGIERAGIGDGEREAEEGGEVREDRDAEGQRRGREGRHDKTTHSSVQYRTHCSTFHVTSSVCGEGRKYWMGGQVQSPPSFRVVLTVWASRTQLLLHSL